MSAAEMAARESPLTAITSKGDVTVVDIVPTRMLGAHGFLAACFAAFEEQSLSVDVVATSDVSVSLTLDPLGLDLACVEAAAAALRARNLASVEVRRRRSHHSSRRRGAPERPRERQRVTSTSRRRCSAGRGSGGRARRRSCVARRVISRLVGAVRSSGRAGAGAGNDRLTVTPSRAASLGSSARSPAPRRRARRLPAR